MIRFRTYNVAPEVVAKARSMGIFGDTSKRLSRMARRSASFTHAQGNKRFMDYLLDIQDSEVKNIHLMDPDTMEVLY